MNHTTLTLFVLLLIGTTGLLKAQDFYLPLSTSSPDAVEAYQAASELASNIHMALARQEIDKALKADPEFFMAYAYKSQVLASKEEKPAIIDQALALEQSGLTKAESIMRRYLVALKADPKAMPTEAMRSLVEAYPETPEAYQWAYLHAAYTEDKPEAAMKYANRLIELAPEFPPVYNGLGYLYMSKLEMDKAKAQFEKYLALAPEEGNAYDSMGEYYAINKQYCESAKYYAHAATLGMEGALERAQKALSLLYEGTKGHSATPPATGSSIERNILHVESVWDRIVNHRQLDQINSSNFASDIVMKGGAEDLVGIDAFKAYYQNYLTGFSDISFTAEDVFGQADKLVKHWRFTGKHTGEFFGIPATGNAVDVEGVTLIKMKDGKIAQEQDFIDNMVFFEQLGLLPNAANVALIDGMYNAFAAGDIPAVLATLDAQVVWNEAEGNDLADGNPYVGPDAVLNGVFARLGAEHEYFKLKDIHLHAMADNQVLATLRYDARRKKSGKLIDAQAAHLWTIRDGKVTAFQQYVDTKQLAEATAKR